MRLEPTDQHSGGLTLVTVACPALPDSTAQMKDFQLHRVHAGAAITADQEVAFLIQTLALRHFIALMALIHPSHVLQGHSTTSLCNPSALIVLQDTIARISLFRTWINLVLVAIIAQVVPSGPLNSLVLRALSAMALK